MLLVGAIPREGAAQATEVRIRAVDSNAPSILGHLEHAVALSEERVPPPRARWTPAPAQPIRNWPLRADPRRWPRLFANTSECTLSFDPVLRRHWWQ